jgi:hypothetical protein
MLDHILEHLQLAEDYEANAARIGALNSRSKRLRDLEHRCQEAAERERAEADSHVRCFDIDALVIAQEHAIWRRLRQYSFDRVETLTLADVVWLRTVFRHGRCGSRCVRRAAELLYLTGAFLAVKDEDDTRSSPPENVGAGRSRPSGLL